LKEKVPTRRKNGGGYGTNDGGKIKKGKELQL